MSKDTEQDVAFIRALAQLLRETDLVEIEVEREYGEDDELKVRLSRAASGVQVAAQPSTVSTVALQAPTVASPQTVTDELQAAPASNGPDLTNAVRAPMVGTAYLAPEPDAANFVMPGDEVAEGDTILIIEAMKTMNQIPSPRAGRVRTVLVENGEPVEFGEPLVIIE